MAASPHLRVLPKSFSKSDVFTVNPAGKKSSLRSGFTEMISMKKVDSIEENNSPKIYFHEDIHLNRKNEEDNKEITLEIIKNMTKSQKQLIKKVDFLHFKSWFNQFENYRENLKKLSTNFANI